MRRPSKGEPGERSAATEKDVEAAAVRLLARREHSTEELKRKLLVRGYPLELIAPVLQKLGGKRLVSDDRFTASYLHHHSRRGQGPVRIRAELRRQGVDDSRIEQALEQADIDWKGLAAEVRRRKFGAATPRALPERAKQARFLQYRGFDADQIRAALDPRFAGGATGSLDPGERGGWAEPDPESDPVPDPEVDPDSDPDVD